jgi:hypothetical protein
MEQVVSLIPTAKRNGLGVAFPRRAAQKRHLGSDWERKKEKGGRSPPSGSQEQTLLD